MDLNQSLREMVERKGSDFHIRVGAPPLVRIDGVLYPMRDERLSPEEVQEIVDIILSEKQKEIFHHELAVDSSYSVEGFMRFRVNVFQQRNTVALVLRNIATKVPTIEQSDLPQVLKTFCDKPQGLVLVSGPTGSGKSQTLASMLQYINSTRRVHVITIEDPIEFLCRDDKAFITQREVGIDTPSYEDALKNSLRQDPDVILIGEMRSLDTMTTALSAAETGHLVFSTIHANSSYEVVPRIVDSFPADVRPQIRLQLADVLLGSIFQRLVPLREGKGRVAAVEVLKKSPRIKELIEKNEIKSIREEMEISVTLHRMQTFEQSLIALLVNKKISYKDAASLSLMPGEMKLAMDKLGINENGDILEKGAQKDGPRIEF